MATWVENIERRASIVLAQMASAIALADKAGVTVADAARPYSEILLALYRDELPLAHVIDTSDLVVEFRGPSVDREAPILKVVSGAFLGIREEMQRVAKAIVGLAASEHGARLPDRFELALTGLARGSLTVGVSVTRPSETPPGETALLLGEDDPLYLAVRSAIRSIAVVTKHVTEDGVDTDLSREIPDPAVRDAVVVAAKRLSPTGRQGINSVSIYSSDVSESYRELTPEIRKALTQTLRQPVRTKERGSYEGIVREIDLDARRFEIRHVRGIGVVRCAYPETLDSKAKRYLDARIRVEGLVERAVSGEVRLMQAQKVRIVEAARRPKQSRLVK